MKGETYEVRVRHPGLRKNKGYSDLVETSRRSAASCYYVAFPALGYGGYFQASAITLVRRRENVE